MLNWICSIVGEKTDSENVHTQIHDLERRLCMVESCYMSQRNPRFSTILQTQVNQHTLPVTPFKDDLKCKMFHDGLEM